MKTVAKLHNPELCAVKVRNAADLDREQTAALMNWCDHQAESLWDGMSLQEIVNVYRVSSEYETFEAMAEELGDKARRAWNRVTLPRNHLMMAGA